MLEFKIYDYLTADAKYIREKVFVEEQGFKEEFDSIDNISLHIILVYDGKSIATSRAFLEDDYYHIGRVAVLKEYRSLKLGSKMLAELEKEIKKRGGKKVILGSQVRAKEFYQKNGYKEYGEEYLDEGCPHIHMIKEL